MESEKLLERLLKNIIENTMGGLCLKLLSQHTTGLPDRLCLLPGESLFFVELKSTGKKPRKIQTVVHNKLSRLGFKTYVIDSKFELLQILNKYSENITGYDPTMDNSEYDYGHNVKHRPFEDNATQ